MEISVILLEIWKMVQYGMTQHSHKSRNAIPERKAGTPELAQHLQSSPLEII